ncbi:hypothetical protein QWM81_18100 [Streptomyces ficellus]|uniref:Uncharacterized protein n=1 Tax=Streptomyces ficellus TaxID=1977088 RepID=A0ABT7Z908_9ACTN|nr:hypothetical protein [Streptomyces ficellus]MDN3295930.1 hypothetical protein [Streptomyces ficellus]
MEKIEFKDIVRVYLRTVPGAKNVLRGLDDPPRSSFEVWPEEEADLFEFLSRAFTKPILIPKMCEEPLDREVLTACFDFVEGLAKNPNPYVQNALYFEVYEQFLDAYDLLLTAQKFSGPVARASLQQMLAENYPATWKRLKGQADS